MFGRRKKKEDKKQIKKAQMIIEEKQETTSRRVVRKIPELTTFARTATGNRQYQQDALYVSPSKRLAANKKTRVFAIVCDGMGGMAEGGRASHTAIEMMVQGFLNVEKDPMLNIPQFFRQGIQTVDQRISSFPREEGKGSGTTMVACIVEDNRLYWASVGDSRIYIIRGTQIQQVTRDHNYALRLQEMVDAGMITLEEAQTARHKEALISFLGMGNISLMDINRTPFEMQLGDVIMLCSDGITKTLPDAQIRQIITADVVKPEQKAEALIDAATHANTHSQDNTSVILICYQEKDIKSFSIENNK